MIALTFACGHQGTTDGKTTPVCPTCGNAQVQTVKARAPRFVGVATGPYCETKALEAIPVSLARTPLPLKAQE